MKTDVYSRMYGRLDDLIPNLMEISCAGATFYAPPHTTDALALYYSVTACHGDMLELELAKDVLADGVDLPAHWMKFLVDRAQRTARLVACQTGILYQDAQSESIYVTSHLLPLNSFAVNWLGVLVHLQLSFRAVVPLASSEDESIARR